MSSDLSNRTISSMDLFSNIPPFCGTRETVCDQPYSCLISYLGNNNQSTQKTEHQFRIYDTFYTDTRMCM